ncbi:Protein ae7 [Datura stramonium]|uniref:Protein ae7 n=1 Tax=Datura stramonium TaxID=4076 RepID=A0ABS8TGW3_DATST|nr:Protein ae7 [Datura stramonium]
MVEYIRDRCRENCWGHAAFGADLRDIKDPEHPYSLEELKVITEDAVEVDDKRSYVRVTFTPTVEHCSMATVIGLCLRVKLMRSLPSRYKKSIIPKSHGEEVYTCRAGQSIDVTCC